MGVDKTILETKIKVGSDVSEAISGFKTLEQTLKKLNLGSVFNEKIGATFAKLYKSGEKMSEAIASGFKDKGDVTKYNAALTQMESALTSIRKEIAGIDPKKIDWTNPSIDKLKVDLQSIKNEIAQIGSKLKGGEAFQNLEKLLDSKAGQKSVKFKEFFEAFKNNDLDKMNALVHAMESIIKKTNENTAANKFWTAAYTNAKQITDDFTNQLNSKLDNQLKMTTELEAAQTKEVDLATEAYKTFAADINSSSDALLANQHALGKTAEATSELNQSLDRFKQRAMYFFGMENAVRLFRRAIRAAFNDVKELDQVMTQTAVVTDFSVGDLWSQLPEYTKRANALGVSIKSAYEAATLYYQQGLKTNEVVAVSTETLKMARIAGLDAATATDRMTNALRGFNMEINEASAQRINDVYSKLAAITASDVDEISTAMTKVASLANNANMSFEKTSAFLAQIIETTRESAETAGTALKTVVARFSEVKELYTKGQLLGADSEGEEININRVSKALATAGINLNEYFTGMKGLDDIFIELASKWDSLDEVQQRYIATMAAGSRQQSRFIAMMQDYDRTLQLVDAAENAAGASTEQFNKTLESLETKLNQLKNAWTTFTTGIANSSVIKVAVDLVRGLLGAVNSLTGKLPGLLKMLANTALLAGGLKLGKTLIPSLLGKLGSAWRGEGIKAGTNFGRGFTAAIKGVFAKNKVVQDSYGLILTDARKRVMELDLIQNKLTKGTKDWFFALQQKNVAQQEANELEAISFNTGFQKLSVTEQGVIAQKALNDETFRANLIEGKYTETQLKEIAAQQANNTATSASFGLRLKSKFLILGEQIAHMLNIGALKGETGATVVQDGALRSLTVSTVAATAASVAFLAIIAALAIAIAAFVIRQRKAQEAQKKWTEDLKTSADQAQEVSNKYVSITNAIEDLSDKEHILEGYIKHTEAWNEALKDVNEQIEAIIKESPEFGSYFTWDSTLGRYVYDPKELESVTKKQKEYGLFTSLATTALRNEKAVGYSTDAMHHTVETLVPPGADLRTLEHEVTTQQEAIDFTKAVLQQQILYAERVRETSPDSDDPNNFRNELYYPYFDEASKTWKPRKGATGRALENATALANNYNQYLTAMEGNFEQATLTGPQQKFLAEETGLSSELVTAFMYTALMNSDTADLSNISDSMLQSFFQEYNPGANVEVKGGKVKVNGEEQAGARQRYYIYQQYLELAKWAETLKQDNFAKGLLDGSITVSKLATLSSNLGGPENPFISQVAQQLYEGVPEAQAGLASMLGIDKRDLLSYNARFIKTAFNAMNGVPENVRQDFGNYLLGLSPEEQLSAIDALQQIPKEGFKTVDNLNSFIAIWVDTFGTSSEFSHIIDLIKQNNKWTIELGHNMSETVKTTKEAIDALKGTDPISAELQAAMVHAGVSEDLFVQTPDGTYIFKGNKNKAIGTLMDSALFEAETAAKNLFNVPEGKRQGYLDDLLANIGRIATSGSPELVEGMVESEWFQDLNKVYGEQIQAYLKALSTTSPLLQNYATYNNRTTEGMVALFSASSSQKDVDDFLSKLSEASYYLSQGTEEAKKYQYQLSDLIILSRQVFGPGVSVELLADNWELLERVINKDADAFLEFQKIVLQDSLYPVEENLDDLIEKMDGFGLIKMEELSAGARETLESLGWVVIETAEGFTLFNKAYNNYISTLSKGSGSGSGSGKDSDWKNPFDELHNQLEAITAIQTKRNQLEREYSRLLRDESASQKDVTNKLYERLENLREEARLQRGLAAGRKEQLDRYMGRSENVGLDQYIWFDTNNGKVYIDWNAIDAAGKADSDEGKRIEDYVNEVKRLNDSYLDAADKADEIEDSINDIHQTMIDSYINFENRIKDALVHQEQERIDMLSKINDSINDATDKLFDQAQKQIDEYRRARENQETESEIADKEARLAYLRRDTSGANALEIKKLEEELGDARQDYADSRIDQALEEMRNEADLAAEQRAEQIAIEQAILDYMNDTGGFWDRVHELMESSVDDNGNVITGSKLEEILKKEDAFGALSKVAQGDWTGKYKEAVKQNSKDALNETFYSTDDRDHQVATEKSQKAIKDAIDNQSNKEVIGSQVDSLLTNLQNVETVGMAKTQENSAVGVEYYHNVLPTLLSQMSKLMADIRNDDTLTEDEKWLYTDLLYQKYVYYAKKYNAIASSLGEVSPWIQYGYATGGLASFTGPAWLDGSRSHPEYVLNAAQTEGFLQLVDMFTKPQDAFSGAPGFGDNYFDIDINAEIGSDYDVDQLVERIKTKITEDSMYRNVNAINFIR